MTDSDITIALEKFARRQLLGGWFWRTWSWLLYRKRFRAMGAAINAPRLNKSVLTASVRLWLSECRRQAERAS